MSYHYKDHENTEEICNIQMMRLTSGFDTSFPGRSHHTNPTSNSDAFGVKSGCKKPGFFYNVEDHLK